jgi:hypothetical protein
MREYPRVLSATSLIGNKVLNMSGEELGGIVDACPG